MNQLHEPATKGDLFAIALMVVIGTIHPMAALAVAGLLIIVAGFAGKK